MWYLRYHTRRLVRSFMKPMDPVLAEKWLKRMRLIYLLSGLSALSLCIITFKLNQEKVEAIPVLDTTPSHKKLRLKGEPGRVLITRFSFSKGFESYEYNNEDYIEEYNKKVKELEAAKA